MAKRKDIPSKAWYYRFFCASFRGHVYTINETPGYPGWYRYCKKCGSRQYFVPWGHDAAWSIIHDYADSIITD